MKAELANRNTLLKSLAIALTVASASVIPASATTYFMDQIIGTGSAVGTIVTDGATGVLSPSDFTAWDIRLNGANGVSYTITNLDPGAQVWGAGSGVTADAAHIYFNFSPGSDFLVFQDGQGSGSRYVCEANFNDVGSCLVGASVVPQYYLDASAQFDHALTGLQIIASAPAPTPGQGLLACLAILAFLIATACHRTA